jgi:hypothetical protein
MITYDVWTKITLKKFKDQSFLVFHKDKLYHKDPNVARRKIIKGNIYTYNPSKRPEIYMTISENVLVCNLNPLIMLLYTSQDIRAYFLKLSHFYCICL